LDSKKKSRPTVPLARPSKRKKSVAFQVPHVRVVDARVAKAVSRLDGHPAFAVDVNALLIVASVA
jgi:hypothetical protein